MHKYIIVTANCRHNWKQRTVLPLIHNGNLNGSQLLKQSQLKTKPCTSTNLVLNGIHLSLFKNALKHQTSLHLQFHSFLPIQKRSQASNQQNQNFLGATTNITTEQVYSFSKFYIQYVHSSIFFSI